jgi:hypothetical protein
MSHQASALIATWSDKYIALGDASICEFMGATQPSTGFDSFE